METNNEITKIDHNTELINKQFELIAEKATQVAKACSNIIITDDTTAALADQKAASVKEIENVINNLHKNLKAKPLELCREIDKAKNSLIEPLTDALAVYKERKKAYILSEQARKEKELEQARKTLEVLENINTESVNAIKQDIEAYAALLTPTKAKGTREVWKFEIGNVNDVPREWMIVDEEKVKAYMNGNKREHIVNGIRFYKDIIIVAG